MMNIKFSWCAQFEEKLWEHHTCDWDAGNRNPDYAWQLAVAYFDWKCKDTPAETAEEAFARYLESLDE